MDLPLLKYLDVLIGFTLIMILAGTVVATITQLCASLGRSRGRYLAKSLCLLLSQADTDHLPEATADKVVQAILCHPLIGKRSRAVQMLNAMIAAIWGWFGKKPAVAFNEKLRGTVVKREQLICVLLGLAGGDKPTVSDALRDAFGVTADKAKELREKIEKEALRLESEKPKEAACERETQALKNVLENTEAHALVARITSWFDEAMNRTTVAYASEAKIATAVVALGVALWFQLDSIAILQRLATDDKMRAALVQQADRQQKKIEELQKQQTPAPAAVTTPAEDLDLLKRQKSEMDVSIADLSQPGLGILTPFYQAATPPGTTVSSSRCDLVVGTKIYPVLRAPNEDLSALVSRINALGAGVAARIRGSGRSAVLTIQSLRPSVNTLELRADAEGINILGPPTVFHAQSAETRSQPLEAIEAGKYRLNLGKKIFELTVQDKQTPADVARAINDLSSDLRARTADGPNCRDCVLVLTASAPDFAHVKLLADSGKADLIRKVAIDGGRMLATTDRVRFPAARDYQVIIGDRKYDAIKLGEKEAFAELAARINASKAGGDLRAAIANASSEDCEDCYILTLAGDVPDVRDIALRKGVGGTDILGPVESYYSTANLANSWKGIFLSWVLLSLGTPFWYDILKNLLRLRPMLAKQEEQERAQRQMRQ